MKSGIKHFYIESSILHYEGFSLEKNLFVIVIKVHPVITTKGRFSSHIGNEETSLPHRGYETNNEKICKRSVWIE